MKKPWYQKTLIQYIPWLFAGIMFVTVLTEAITNLNLIPPWITYSGTAVVAVGYCLAQVILRRWPLKWKADSGETLLLKSLGPATTVALVGIVIALWIPRTGLLIRASTEVTPTNFTGGVSVTVISASTPSSVPTTTHYLSSLTPSPFMAQTQKPELIPVTSPITAETRRYFEDECISVDVWQFFTIRPHALPSTDCWAAEQWGYFAKDGKLRIVYQPQQNDPNRANALDQSWNVGSFTPIPDEGLIQFAIEIDKLEAGIKSDETANLILGITKLDSHPIEGQLIYIAAYEINDPVLSFIQWLPTGEIQPSQDDSFKYDSGQTLTLNFNRADYTLYVDGEQVGEPVLIGTFTKKSFWIGYLLSENGYMDVTLSGLTISDQQANP